MKKWITMLALFSIHAGAENDFLNNATQSVEQRKIEDKEKARHEYIQYLNESYGKNILADNADSYFRIATFNIDCRMNDGRTVPLLNLLLRTIDEVSRSRPESDINYLLESRGGLTRIFYDLSWKGKVIGDPSLYMEINDWDEIIPYSMSTEAILSSCSGFHGPIWILPGEHRQ